ncbi:MAG: polysaccharide biosynthesis protein [Lachnospiraceae bacterium]|jgi:stage V sporulation protein B|nr:polysaccharide biosynthesis protein [Lachnospiraceae bacterium]
MKFAAKHTPSPLSKYRLNNPLVAGTIMLTLTGLVSRFIGFFYRIFLSRLFGAEGMGIYQLTSPILVLTFSITVAGMQTAISKFVAGETTTRDYKSSAEHLITGFIISMTLSILCTIGIYQNADFLASTFLLEPRTAPLLRIIAFSIPMATVHSCINGYFYGVRKTAIPAITQLVEQIVRVGSVFLIYEIGQSRGLTPTINFAVLGLVIGESAAMVVSIIAIRHRFYSLSLARHAKSLDDWADPQPAFLTKKNLLLSHQRFMDSGRRLISLAAPLSLNRIVINSLHSIEAIYIPNRLMASGLDNSTALGVYGVLTGMALPLILFPSAITNSICVLLLPIVSEADAASNTTTIKKAVRKSIQLGALLGGIFTGLFLLFGKQLGIVLYQNSLAGSFMITLSFLCPFMYIASTLSSILNGMGKTGLTFAFSTVSLLVRLAFVFWALPIWGIQGYLWGLLVSQFLQTGLCMFAVRKFYSPFRT